MNFILAKMVEGGGYRIGGATFPGPRISGGEILFGIRPEDLIVGDGGGDGADAVEARVRVVEPLAPHLLLTVGIDGQPARVPASPDLSVRSGATLRLRPNPDRIRRFEPESGQAMHWGQHENGRRP